MGKLTSKILAIGILAIGQSIGPATADTPFDGIYAGLGLGLGVSTSTTTGDFNYDNLNAGAGDGAAAAGDAETGRSFDLRALGALNLGYGLSLPSKYHLNLELAGHMSGDETIAEDGLYVFPNPNGRADFLRDLKIETKIDPKSHFSLSVQPGYKVRDDLLLFGTLAYHHMRSEVSSATSFDRTIVNAAVAVTESKETEIFHGVGLGVGARYKLTSNLALKVAGDFVYFVGKKLQGPSISSSADEITFFQNTRVDPSHMRLSIGLTYSF